MPKVLKILSLLDVRSYKSFLKYLDSPYLNTNRKLLDFATYLFKYHPEFGHKNLKKENLDRFLFPGTSYNRKRKEAVFMGRAMQLYNTSSFYLDMANVCC